MSSPNVVYLPEQGALSQGAESGGLLSRSHSLDSSFPLIHLTALCFVPGPQVAEH